MPIAELSFESGVPLYRQIKEILRREILDGTAPADRSMTEAQLLERFDVSRAPIRQALKELTVEGYVYRKQGKGTFPVSGARVERPANIRSGGLYDYLVESGRHPVSRVTEPKFVVPPKQVQRDLELSGSEELLHFTRLLSVNDQPIAEITVYVNVPADFRPTRQELEESGSAFSLLERRYGITLEHAEHAASAVAATAAQAKTLQTTKGHPLLLLETIFYITGGVAAGWRSAIHHGEDFKYRFSANH